MPARPANAVIKPIALPPLPRLRVKKPNQTQAQPCVDVMQGLLTCWASSGYNVAGCAALEQQLRVCMDTQGKTTAGRNTINHHLSRFWPKIIGPHKRK